MNVAYTSLSTKVNAALAKQLAADVVDAVSAIRLRHLHRVRSYPYVCGISA